MQLWLALPGHLTLGCVMSHVAVALIRPRIHEVAPDFASHRTAAKAPGQLARVSHRNLTNWKQELI